MLVYQRVLWQFLQLAFARIDRELSGDEMSALQDLRSPEFPPCQSASK